MLKTEVKTSGDLLQWYTVQKKEYLDRVKNEAINILKINTPVDHGTLRNSWNAKKQDDSYLISNSRTYSVPIFMGSGLYGSKPHLITPKSKKVLRFETRDGKIVYTKHTKGYNANKRWEKCLKQIQTKITNIEFDNKK